MCIAREGDVIINGTCDIEADMNQDFVVWCGLTLRFTCRCIEVCGFFFGGVPIITFLCMHAPQISSIALLLCVCVCVCVGVGARRTGS